MKPITNHARSVKDKLLNLMRDSGKEYMYLLARYFNERLLYRISVSRFKDNFILKGGSLLYAMDGLNARPTVDFDFPLLIPSLPPVNITAYSIETVIAEKFHAMIDRDIVNSRMKDFFDCYMLLSKNEISDEILFQAICETFDNRKLLIKSNLQLFSKEFYSDKGRLQRWKSFLKKIKWKEEIGFDEVMKLIDERLRPLYERYVELHKDP